MTRGFKPVRFSALIGLAALVACGVAVLCTHRGEHGRTAEERTAYEIGEKAGEQTPPNAKLPTDAELNTMAEKYFEYQAPGAQLQNPPPPGGLEARKQAFVKGYTAGFKKRIHRSEQLIHVSGLRCCVTKHQRTLRCPISVLLVRGVDEDQQ
jgi:hypothetical protein